MKISKALVYICLLSTSLFPLVATAAEAISPLWTPPAGQFANEPLQRLVKSLKIYNSQTRPESAGLAIVLSINSVSSKDSLREKRIQNRAQQALFVAASAGDSVLAGILIDAFGLDVNMPTAKSKVTPLMLAAQGDSLEHRDTVYKLIMHDEQTVYRKITDASGKTALDHAMASGHADSATLLKGGLASLPLIITLEDELSSPYRRQSKGSSLPFSQLRLSSRG